MSIPTSPSDRSVWWTRRRVVQKRRNRSIYRLGCGLWEAQETTNYVGVPDPAKGRDTFGYIHVLGTGVGTGPADPAAAGPII